MIKAIIFDCDETLIKYSFVGTPSLQRAAKELSLYVPTKKEINALYGRSFKFVVESLWGKGNYKDIYVLYKKYVMEKKVKEIPGTKKTIEFLFKYYKLGVVSAKIRDIMIKNFDDVNFDTSKFDIMLSSEDTTYHKPDPRVFNKVLKKIKFKRNEILYIGDTLFDFMAATRAGFKFVAVTSGYFTKKDFLNSGVKKENIIGSVKEIKRWLAKYS